MEGEISLHAMAGLYVVAGIFHFVKPNMYEAVIPPYLPNPRALVLISGFFEIAFGVGLLFEETRELSAWGIMLMLLVFLPAHIYMLQSEKFGSIPAWALWLRIPLQFVLIYWAYQFA
ncbi:DoxX family protein [Tunicatimonas pelagia]|uniref:DoxX family protein n=1 Tax=Tunicatimonas pelagia TaxID=931531 RepID=UPI00266563FC|nr:MauE/DoxX family redox-associated membrane protein [Tunicatimonas pelagia]WKN41057.1 DoxX family protein [Tunicatimonas pelagia]